MNWDCCQKPRSLEKALLLVLACETIRKAFMGLSIYFRFSTALNLMALLTVLQIGCETKRQPGSLHSKALATKKLPAKEHFDISNRIDMSNSVEQMDQRIDLPKRGFVLKPNNPVTHPIDPNEYVPNGSLKCSISTDGTRICEPTDGYQHLPTTK
jgi:hypothetical protein